ncbi:MAG: hypothetical protein AAF483_25925 [Planctomycetota bacterium]
MIQKESKPTDSEFLAQWWVRGVPALAVASVACLIGVYLLFLLPNRLPNNYRQSLEPALESYNQARAASPIEAIKAGGIVANIYSRLHTYFPEEQSWEEVTFYDQHLDWLERQQTSNAISDASNLLTENIESFRSRLRKLIRKLITPGTELSRKAILFASAKESRALIQAEEMLSVLEALLHQTPEDEELRLALLAIQLRIAWQPSQAGLPNITVLKAASSGLNDVPDLSPALLGQKLTLDAILDSNPSDVQKEASELLESITKSNSRNTHFDAAIRAQLVLGNWSEASKWLSQKQIASPKEFPQIRLAVSQQILQLYFSNLIHDEDWAIESADGIQLAWELSGGGIPDLLPPVLWLLADSKSARAPDFRRVNDSVRFSNLPHRHLVGLLQKIANGDAEQFSDEWNGCQDALPQIAMQLDKSETKKYSQARLIIIKICFLPNSIVSDDARSRLVSFILKEREDSRDPTLALAAAHCQLLLEDLAGASKSLELARPAYQGRPDFQILQTRLQKAQLGSQAPEEKPKTP